MANRNGNAEIVGIPSRDGAADNLTGRTGNQGITRTEPQTARAVLLPGAIDQVKIPVPKSKNPAAQALHSTCLVPNSPSGGVRPAGRSQGRAAPRTRRLHTSRVE